MLVSFIIGLAVAAVGVSLLNREPASAFLEESATASGQSVGTSDPPANGDSRSAVPNELANDSESGEIKGSGDTRSADGRSPQPPPPEQPIPLPPEFEWLATDPAHDLVQREPHDVNWAPAIEARFSRFLSENPELVQTYGYPRSIVCRTSMCELLFVAYGLETTLNGEQLEGQALGHVVLRDFHQSILNSEFFERTEFEEFRIPIPVGSGSLITASQHTENGVTSIAWLLRSEDRVNHPGGAFAITDERRRTIEDGSSAADPRPASAR